MDETLEEEVMVTCPRCGGHDVPEGDDHCSNCEYWIPCDRCGAYHESDYVVDGDNWCDRCFENNAETCRRCGVHTTDTLAVDGDLWCRNCWEQHAYSCEECGGSFSDSDNLTNIQGGEAICEDCLENGRVFSWCENREDYHRATRDCECGCRSSSRPDNSNRGVAGYGCHGEFKIKNSYGESPVFGMEMEIGNYPSQEARQTMVTEFYKKLGWDFAYPTSDSSLGNYGIEFIGHPLSALDHVGDERYDIFFQQLINSRAFCHRNSSGCHMTTDRSSFKSDDALRAALAVVKRFEKALLKFTHEDTRSSRQGYARSDWDSNKDPLRGAGNIGKYSAVNINKRSLVEFRIPGMQIDIKRHLAQVQLYHNLMSWCNWVTDWKEAGKASFADIFLPVMYQDSIEDCVQCGLTTPEMEFNMLGAHILTCIGVKPGLNVGTVGGAPAVYIDNVPESYINLCVSNGRGWSRSVNPGDVIWSKHSRRLGICLDNCNSADSVYVISRNTLQFVSYMYSYNGRNEELHASFVKSDIVRANDFRGPNSNSLGGVMTQNNYSLSYEVVGCKIIRHGDMIEYNGERYISFKERENTFGLRVLRPDSGLLRNVFQTSPNDWISFTMRDEAERFTMRTLEDRFSAYDTFITNFADLTPYDGGAYRFMDTASTPIVGRIEVSPDDFYSSSNGICINHDTGMMRVGNRQDYEQCLYPRRSCNLIFGDVVIAIAMTPIISIKVSVRGEPHWNHRITHGASSDFKWCDLSFHEEYRRLEVNRLPRTSLGGVYGHVIDVDSLPDLALQFSRVDSRAAHFGDLILRSNQIFFFTTSMDARGRGYSMGDDVVILRPTASGSIKMASNGEQAEMVVSKTTSGNFKVTLTVAGELKLCYFVRG